MKCAYCHKRIWFWQKSMRVATEPGLKNAPRPEILAEILGLFEPIHVKCFVKKCEIPMREGMPVITDECPTFSFARQYQQSLQQYRFREPIFLDKLPKDEVKEVKKVDDDSWQKNLKR